MRALVVLAGGLALTACASTERVTLLSPAQAGKQAACAQASAGATAPDGSAIVCPVGGVEITHNKGRVSYISEANQQAHFSRSRSVRVRNVDEGNPLYGEVMGGLPIEPVTDNFYFATGKSELAPEELERLRVWLNEALAGRVGAEIEITAHTDATGDEAINNRVSLGRAETVRDQVYSVIDAGGIPALKEDVQSVAGSWHWARSFMRPGEVAQPDERFRVVVVTVR